MIVGVPKETFPGERRVALVPGALPALTRASLDILVEAAAGTAAGFPDSAYVEKGARIAESHAQLFAEADIVLQVRSPGAAGEAGTVDLAWHVWDDGGSVELARFAPSVAFGRNYLPFADQYDETPRLWSPDSDAITFGASTSEGDMTAVARLDNVGGLTTLGPSDVSFWSPLPDSLQAP